MTNATKRNTRTRNTESVADSKIKLSPDVPPRHSIADCASSRVVRAEIRYGNAETGTALEEAMWASIDAKAVFDDGPISLETAMYIETDIEKEWDDITLERFDAQVNLLVALRDKLFAIAVPGSERLVVKNWDEEQAA